MSVSFGEVDPQKFIFNKIRGTLEIEGAEALPPTRISAEAKKSLEKWGLTQGEIEALRSLSSQFRYDLCPEKVARLSRAPVEIFDRDGQEYANLPTFFDISGRFDGQCSDIAGQWIIQMNESGLLGKLNQGKRNSIVLAHYSGNSETHFCVESSCHVWNGLALADTGRNILDEIYFDAAFQTIHSKKESKYKQIKGVCDINGVEINEDMEVQVGWVEIDGCSWKGFVPSTAVLGVSSDFQLAFSMGFLRDRHTNGIRPVLKVNFPNGNKTFFLRRDDGYILKTDNFKIDNMDEIERILIEASKMGFVEKPPTRNSIVWKRQEA